MRFQQLKRNSNMILKKKMYKSGKDWAVKSTLSLMGGLVLLGVSQTNMVKADTNTNSIPVSQATAVADSQPKQAEDDTKSVNEEDSTNPVEPKTSNNQYIGQRQVEKSDTDNAQYTDGKINTPINQQSVPATTPKAYLRSAIPDNNQQGQGTTASNVSTSTNDVKGTNWEVNGSTLSISGGTLSTERPSDNYWKEFDKGDIETISFDENNKTVAGSDIEYLFDNFINVKQITGLGGFDTSQTTNMRRLFSQCSNLTTIEGLNKLNVSNVENFESIFDGDRKLTQVAIPDWHMDRGMDFAAMFTGMDSLKNITLPTSWNSINLNSDERKKKNFHGMFQGNQSLQSLNLTKLDMSETEDVWDSIDFITTFEPEAADATIIDKLSTLTLSNKNYLKNSDDQINRIPKNGDKKVVGWKVVGNDGKTLLAKSDNDWKNMYDGHSSLNVNGVDTANPDGVTWTWDWEPPIKFKVSYVPQDDPSAKAFYTSDYITVKPDNEQYYEYDEFQPETLSSLNLAPDNYDTSFKPEAISLKQDMDGKTISVPIPRKDYTVQVEMEDTNGNKTPITIHVPINKQLSTDKDYQGQLNKLSNDIEILPYDETTKKGSHLQDSSGFYSNISESMLSASGGASPKYIVSMLISSYSPDGYMPENMMGQGMKFYFLYKALPSNSNSKGTSSAQYREVQGIEERVGTFYDKPDVQLYDDSGSELTDRKLVPNSDWFTDESMSLNGVKYYRVATNEWTKAKDVYLYYPDSTDVLVNRGNVATLVTAEGKTVTDRALQANSDWYTDRYIYINNAKYYRVATNEFVSADDVEEY